MKTKKILVKIWSPLLDKLNLMAKDSCIKRDNYLNLVLSHEATMLEKEVIQKNSERAKKYLSSKLLELNDFKSVNLLLEEETVERINRVCKEKNIPRDCFLNRVFLFLTATRETLENLFEGYGDTIGEVLADNYNEHYFAYRSNIFDTIAEFIETDPFWLLRGSLRKMKEDDESIEENLHNNKLVIIKNKTDDRIDYRNKSLVGFDCYISDGIIDALTALDKFFNEDDLEKRKESRRLEAQKIKESLTKREN